MPVAEKAFNIIQTAFPQFSGVTGQIDHTLGLTTNSRKKISETSALRVAAIWIATTLLSDEIGALPLKLVRRGDNTRILQRPPGLESLWGDEPNPDQTKFGIDATETMSMLLWGFSVTHLGWVGSGKLDLRWPLDPGRVTLSRLEDGGMKLKSIGQGELFNHKGQRPEFEYVPLYTMPGTMKPVSPVEAAAELAGLSVSYQEAAANLMGRGFNPAAVITGDEWIEQSEAEDLAERLERIHGGSGKSGGIAVLGSPGLKLERLTMSMADAEFIEQNEYVFKVLLAMWRVPPTAAGMVDKPSTWGTGIAEFSQGLRIFALRHLKIRRELAHQKYITKWVDPTLEVKYNFDSMLSVSPKERQEIQRSRLLTGMTSQERILTQEDEPPFDDEETVFSQLAMATDEQRNAVAIEAQARAAAALIAAGAGRDEAFAAVGLDPKALKVEEPEVIEGTPPEAPTPPNANTSNNT